MRRAPDDRVVPGTPNVKFPDVKPADETPTRPRGLEELDVLGEALLKQSLPANKKPATSFQKPAERVPMNLLAQQKALTPVQPTAARVPDTTVADVTESATKCALYPMDFDLLAGSSPLLDGQTKAPTATVEAVKQVQDGDVCLLDTVINSENSISANDDVQMLHSPVAAVVPVPKMVPPPLGDISLCLQDIKPSTCSFCQIPAGSLTFQSS